MVQKQGVITQEQFTLAKMLCVIGYFPILLYLVWALVIIVMNRATMKSTVVSAHFIVMFLCIVRIVPVIFELTRVIKLTDAVSTAVDAVAYALEFMMVSKVVLNFSVLANYSMKVQHELSSLQQYDTMHGCRWGQGTPYCSPWWWL